MEKAKVKLNEAVELATSVKPEIIYITVSCAHPRNHLHQSVIISYDMFKRDLRHQ